MKYSESNKPIVCMQTQSTCYKETATMQVKGILWHSTGANNPWLLRYVQPSDNDANKSKLLELIGKNKYSNDWNHTYVEAGLNAWIGKLDDGTVATVQTMPWNYRPWGCASGNNGSCNNGWIQFEICEDSLSDKSYFEKAYKEACELTAYLCKMYNLDPYGYRTVNGVKVPVILCHYDSYNLGMGSNHGDVYHWFKKYGKTMDDVRKDVAELLGSNVSKPTPTEPKEMYRVRKSWKDAESQIGAYTVLQNAKDACDKAGSGYEVYNSKGVVVYPASAIPVTFKVGDEVKLVKGAKYTSGVSVPGWVIDSKLYVRELQGDNIVISTLKAGAITGVVNKKYITRYSSSSSSTSKFTPYIVRVTVDALNIRAGAGTNYGINGTIRDRGTYTIVDEKNGFGKLKSGAGWIYLDYTEKV